MKYDLKKEREKKGLYLKYIRHNVPGLSSDRYSKLEKKGEIDPSLLYLLHKHCGYELPEDYHKYTMTTIKINCSLKNIPAKKFFEEFCAKTNNPILWITRLWQTKNFISLYDYKDVIDEIFPEIYIPCTIEDNCVKIYGENNVVFPINDTKYYWWGLYTDTLQKEGIVAATSSEEAFMKLERYNPCKIDEYYEIMEETDAIHSDIGVFIRDTN